MSLTGIDELPGHSTRLGERGRVDHTRIFLGFSNNPYDSPLSILASRLCPKVGERDPFDATAVIVDVQAKRRQEDEPGNLWEITYSSSTEYDEYGSTSPLALPSRITWHSAKYEKEVFRDFKGKMITTTAGTPLRRVIEAGRWIISVEKNLKDPPQWLLEYPEAINVGAVTVDGIPFAKETLKCSGLRIGERIFETFQRQRISYRTVSFTLEYKRETWKTKTPNVDWMEMKEAEFLVKKKDGSYELDKQNRPVRKKAKQRSEILVGEPKSYPREPWPLKKDGSMLPEGYGPDDPTLVESDDYAKLDFNKLPLR